MNGKENMPIPAPVRLVLTTLHEAGYEAYVVGGCVRDHLMGRVPGDYDVTSAALPEECMETFRGWRIIETGLQHGTVTVVAKGESGHENVEITTSRNVDCCTSQNVEITTFRIDGAYLDNRHPENVTFTRSLSEDLARRDFTVNAMAYSDPTGVIDLYGGQSDLAAGIIRCVGDAEKRFREDGLRILRALRFSSVLDFVPAADDGNTEKLSTAAAIHALRSLLLGISRERIHVELTKLLCGPGAGRILRAYPDVCGTILPMLTDVRVTDAACGLDSLYGMRGVVSDILWKEPAIRYALLFDNCTEAELREGLRSLKMSRAEEGRIRALWSHRHPPETEAPADLRYRMRQTAGAYGYDFCRLEALLHCGVGRLSANGRDTLLRYIDELEEENPCCSLAALALNGQDLQHLGITGPAIGQTLRALLERVLRDALTNDKEALLQALEENRNG